MGKSEFDRFRESFALGMPGARSAQNEPETASGLGDKKLNDFFWMFPSAQEGSRRGKANLALPLLRPDPGLRWQGG